MGEQSTQDREAIEFRPPQDGRWGILAVAILAALKAAGSYFDSGNLLPIIVYVTVGLPLLWIGYRFHKVPLVSLEPEAIEAWTRWCRRTRIAFNDVSAIVWQSSTLALEVGNGRVVLILAGLRAEDRATIGRLVRERMAGPEPDEARLAEASRRQRTRERLLIVGVLLPPLALAAYVLWLVLAG